MVTVYENSRGSKGDPLFDMYDFFTHGTYLASVFAMHAHKKRAREITSPFSRTSRFYIESTIALPNSEQLNSVAPSICRSKS